MSRMRPSFSGPSSAREGAAAARVPTMTAASRRERIEFPPGIVVADEDRIEAREFASLSQGNDAARGLAALDAASLRRAFAMLPVSPMRHPAQKFAAKAKTPSRGVLRMVAS